MRIIKFIKYYALGFVLAAVVVGPLSYVTATTIAARNITYNGTNTNSSLTDVQSAIETLYTMSEEKPLISFTINGTTYYAEEGMTWVEWILSKYNTIGLTLLYNGDGAGTIVGKNNTASIENYSYSCGSITYYMYNSGYVYWLQNNTTSKLIRDFYNNAYHNCSFNENTPLAGNEYTFYSDNWNYPL